MKLQHAIGGLENLGPVDLDTRVFAQEWEKRIFGIHTAMMAQSAHLEHALPAYPVAALGTSFKENWTWASLRTSAEGMPPLEYFKYRYFEKWLMGITQFLIARGYISADEVASLSAQYLADPAAPLPQAPNPLLKKQIVDYLDKGDDSLRPLPAPPRFATGQEVLVGDPHTVDHTRLPAYLRNRRGIVTEVYPGAFKYFVSTGPDGLGDPMPVYCVAFNAADIWGKEMSEPNTTIYADLFDVYLKPLH
ncbi:MAG: nthB [Massilia sp.]|nr:nthB [Massilia sp.]